jgi:hypothetical protein
MPLAESTHIMLLEQNIEVFYKKCVLAKYNNKLPEIDSIDILIPSSITAIKWFFNQGINASFYYCIGPQTASFIKDQLPSARICVPPREPYDLNHLLRCISDHLNKNKVLWIGSNQGLLRYSAFLQKHYPFVKTHITHWNWPNFLEDNKAATYFSDADFVVCSSINAAVALSVLDWDCPGQLLLSSPRLMKYFSKWKKQPKPCKHHWLKEIGYN